MVTIDKSKMLTGASARSITSGTGNTKQYLVIHETANTSPGADAEAHAKLQFKGNTREASWHYQVDDQKAYQSFAHGYKCWHAGAANSKSIAIEICVNSDGNYDKAMRNAVELAAKVMKEEKIPLANLTQHNKWTGKHCPTKLRDGHKGWTWNKFVQEVKDELNPPAKPAAKPTPTKPTPAPTPKPTPATTSSSYAPLGVLTVTTSSLNLRDSKSLDAKIIKVLPRNSGWKIAEIDGNWYKLGTGWVSNPRKAYGRVELYSYHKVAKGQTLWFIAKKYQTTVSKLKQLNGLKSDVIQVGDKIRVK